MWRGAIPKPSMLGMFPRLVTMLCVRSTGTEKRGMCRCITRSTELILTSLPSRLNTVAAVTAARADFVSENQPSSTHSPNVLKKLHLRRAGAAHDHAMSRPFGYTHTPETRRKLSEAMKRRPMPAGFLAKGRMWSEESRRKWSEKQSGVKRGPHSLESRKLMSTIAKARRPRLFIDESVAGRNSFEYRAWRESVYQRDDYTCLKCKARGGRLHPHHIVNFASHPELRFDPDNGATLCVGCHKLFHKLFGKKRNTKEQFQQFLGIHQTESPAAPR